MAALARLFASSAAARPTTAAAPARRLAPTTARRSLADAPADTIKFSLLSPHKTIYRDKPIKAVALMSAEGEMAIHPNHAPTITEVNPGLVRITEADNAVSKFFVSGGFAFINRDSTVNFNVLEAVPLDHLDLELARSGLQRANEAMSKATAEQDKALAAIQLQVHQAMIAALEEKQ